MGQRRSFVEAEAIQKSAALNDWQIDEIKKGVTEAGRKDFARDQDVERTMKKWLRRAG
jgi:predicted transcriptional regulator